MHADTHRHACRHGLEAFVVTAEKNLLPISRNCWSDLYEDLRFARVVAVLNPARIDISTLSINPDR